jgi:hypothetical protein
MAKTLSVATIILASVLGITTAQGPILAPYAYPGEQCGLVDGIDRQCVPAPYVICDHMPGICFKTCINISPAGGICNNENTQCGDGLQCVYAPGQTNGVCKTSDGSTTDTITRTHHASLGSQCCLINGINYRCRPFSGLTCDTMPDTNTKTCIRISPAGETCNSINTRCADGLTCVYTLGKTDGKCEMLRRLGGDSKSQVVQCGDRLCGPGKICVRTGPGKYSCERAPPSALEWTDI